MACSGSRPAPTPIAKRRDESLDDISEGVEHFSQGRVCVDHGVHPRRYFYPLITEFPMYQDLPSSNRNMLPIATKAANEILCLPIYPDLDDASVQRIISLIADA